MARLLPSWYPFWGWALNGDQMENDHFRGLMQDSWQKRLETGGYRLCMMVSPGSSLPLNFLCGPTLWVPRGCRRKPGKTGKNGLDEAGPTRCTWIVVLQARARAAFCCAQRSRHQYPNSINLLILVVYARAPFGRQKYFMERVVQHFSPP